MKIWRIVLYNDGLKEKTCRFAVVKQFIIE
jgi:hypothetical protein